MQIILKNIGQHRVMSLKGNVELKDAQKFKLILLKEIKEKKVKTLIVDMKEVDYIDSTAIGILVAGYREMQNTGGEFALANLKKNVMEIFELSSLHRYFSIFEDLSNIKSKLEKSKNLILSETPEISNTENDNIIFKGWVNNNTLRIPSYGKPQKDTTDILQRKIEAKNDAIKRGQRRILESFVESHKHKDWIEFKNYRNKLRLKYSSLAKSGNAVLTEFDSKQSCTIIFEVRGENLKEKILTEIKPR